jgi:hypothetical protein
VIHITPHAITIEDASGKRQTVTADKLKTPTHRLLWGCFYQLQQANVRLGYVDVEKGEGSGLTALLHQVATNTAAIFKQLETLNTTLERAEKQSSDAMAGMDPAKAMREAMGVVREQMADLTGVGVPQPPKSGNGGVES